MLMFLPGMLQPRALVDAVAPQPRPDLPHTAGDRRGDRRHIRRLSVQGHRPRPAADQVTARSRYRVIHLLMDLAGLTMLPSCPAASAKFTSAQAELGRLWNN